MYRQRFGLSSHVFPQDAQGDTYIEGPGYARLKRRFEMLAREPGLGAVEGDAGVGKTAAMRNLCGQLPRPDYQVIYLCDTAVSPLDLYRQLAASALARNDPSLLVGTDPTANLLSVDA